MAPASARHALAALCLVLLLAAQCVFAAPATATAAEPGPRTDSSPGTDPELTALLDEYLAAQPATSLSAALIEDGEITAVLEHGDAQLDTPFHIASLSKSFTAATVMILVDCGLVDLDAPVTDYIADFELADGRQDEITVRMLLSHTTGLGLKTYQENDAPAPADGEELLDRLAEVELAREPGAAHEYFSSNYSLAALLVERVTGSSFDEVLRAELFEPLGMHDSTSVTACGDPAAGTGSGHALAFGSPLAVPEPPGLCLGTGGVVSTAGDLATWLTFIADGGTTPDGARLIAETSVHEMLSPQPATEGAAGDWYGLGWIGAELSDGTPVLSHGGALTTWSSHMTLLVDEEGRPTGTAAVVLADTASSPAQLVGAMLAHATGLDQPEFTRDGRPADDFVPLGLSVLALGLALGCVLRARRWPGLHRRRGAFVGGLLWPVALAAIGVALPVYLTAQKYGAPLSLAGAWPTMLGTAPVAVLLSGSLVLAGAGVLIARSLAWAARRRAGRSDDEEPRGEEHHDEGSRPAQ
ncbi:serine hydrolase [Gulosibacter sp. 10]|uniref:serine hydrolase domain-containing protein n=1 Tax=Gulosibacter sp. 10 TaxID=1255570 RepID=UPI00097E9629|nr:serine hydrolase domain-containing protein [Gulosibacter sp. 10]SJM70801.1 Beta-lactamase class C and other penicillin binding proteins [Gulosibacter sp. 10]